MIEKWLIEEAIGQLTTSLSVRVVQEADGIEDDALYAYLGRELLRNYVVPGELAATFSDLGVPEVADHLVNHKFPTIERIRNGDFGEALGGALFRRVDRWCVPILKLRYKQRPNQPVQGTDFLGFRLRLSPPIIAVPEVKTRTTKRLNVALDARMSLGQVLEDLPSNVAFVVARLAEQGNALASRVAHLLNDDYEIGRHIVLVHDEEEWDDRITERLAETEDTPTTLTVIRLANLRTMIEKAYASAATSPRVSDKASDVSHA